MASSAGLLVGCEPLRTEDTGEGSLTLSWLFVQLAPAKGGGAARRVDLDDCVGVSAEQSVLVLHSVALRRGFCSAPRRVMSQTRFACRDGAQAESWAAAVWNVMHGKAPEASAPARKRWLVLVNPVSGKKGGALKVLRECRPVLEAHRIELKEIVTTHAAHATELAAEIKLDELDGIVCVGGDGLLYELVNGLMARPDADAAVSRLHLGVLPGGSANSMCCSLLRAAGEPLSPLAMELDPTVIKPAAPATWPVSTSDLAPVAAAPVRAASVAAVPVPTAPVAAAPVRAASVAAVPAPAAPVAAALVRAASVAAVPVRASPIVFAVRPVAVAAPTAAVAAPAPPI